MDKVIRDGAVRVGVDLAKRVIQVHAVDAAGRVVTAKALARDKFIEWCVRLPAGCVVAMEASSSAHHWARKLVGLGLDARIISAQLVSPYRSEGATGKNDANDAAAICEAASRPTMRFIPVKSIEQQSMLCVHRLREGIKEDCTACINRIRGLLAEFGLVFPQGSRELQAVLGEVLEDASNELGTLARLTLQRAQSQWHELDAHLAWCPQQQRWSNIFVWTQLGTLHSRSVPTSSNTRTHCLQRLRPYSSARTPMRYGSGRPRTRCNWRRWRNDMRISAYPCERLARVE